MSNLAISSFVPDSHIQQLTGFIGHDNMLPIMTIETGFRGTGERASGQPVELIDTSTLPLFGSSEQPIEAGNPVLYSFVEPDPASNGPYVSQWVGRVDKPRVDTLAGKGTSLTIKIGTVLVLKDGQSKPNPPIRTGIRKIFPHGQYSHLRSLTEPEYQALSARNLSAFNNLQAAKKPGSKT